VDKTTNPKSGVTTMSAAGGDSRARRRSTGRRLFPGTPGHLPDRAVLGRRVGARVSDSAPAGICSVEILSLVDLPVRVGSSPAECGSQLQRLATSVITHVALSAAACDRVDVLNAWRHE
jgi:hypothetical protein